MKILVTGSSGHIGSEVCTYFSNKGIASTASTTTREWSSLGLGDTSWRQKELSDNLSDFISWTGHSGPYQVLYLVKSLKPDAIVHTAAQPSHDKAASIPFDDFDVNAVGTLNLLEATRQFCKIPFCSHVYQQGLWRWAERSSLKELQTRWEYVDPVYENGISESFSIDQSKHSLSEPQGSRRCHGTEYGRYFGMATCCLRGGCLTGPSHSGVELHGFLSYLVKCNLNSTTYKIFGYKGKQVARQHSLGRCGSIHRFICKVSAFRQVYNLGGGKDNSCSILEALNLRSTFWNRTKIRIYGRQPNRRSCCYYSDLTKIKSHYPTFLCVSLSDTIKQIVEARKHRSWSFFESSAI